MDNSTFSSFSAFIFAWLMKESLIYLTKPMLLLFDDNKIKMSRKPGKKQKENPVGYTGEGER